jgi:hypothetical protein
MSRNQHEPTQAQIEENTILELYNPNEFDRPSLAVDIILLTICERQLEWWSSNALNTPPMGSGASQEALLGSKRHSRQQRTESSKPKRTLNTEPR